VICAYHWPEGVAMQQYATIRGQCSFERMNPVLSRLGM
jgi:hypothetical protein